MRLWKCKACGRIFDSFIFLSGSPDPAHPQWREILACCPDCRTPKMYEPVEVPDDYRMDGDRFHQPQETSEAPWEVQVSGRMGAQGRSLKEEKRNGAV